LGRRGDSSGHRRSSAGWQGEGNKPSNLAHVADSWGLRTKENPNNRENNHASAARGSNAVNETNQMAVNWGRAKPALPRSKFDWEV